jgi:hypothetical protein
LVIYLSVVGTLGPGTRLGFRAVLAAAPRPESTKNREVPSDTSRASPSVVVTSIRY